MDNIQKMYNALKNYCENNNDTAWIVGDADFYTKYIGSFCDFYIFPKSGQVTTDWVTIFEYPKASSNDEVCLEVHGIPTAKKSNGHSILGPLPRDFYAGVNKHVLGKELYRVIDKTRGTLAKRMLN